MFHDIIQYDEPMIRPPSEAGSLIFQVTLGCTDNNCTFCPAYKTKEFRIREMEDIEDEFRKASIYLPETRKVFLADGDALAIPSSMLVTILEKLKFYFPRLTRVGIYASPKTLQKKTLNELILFKKLRLGIIYLGIETGDEVLYSQINKYGNPEITVKECLKVKESGIKLNTTVILGLGGKELSYKHALNTARVINQCKPDHIAVLSLMIAEGTKVYKAKECGLFLELSPFEMLEELYNIISNLEDFSCLFFSNHASNYYPINARFPADKQIILDNLGQIIKKRDKKSLKPEYFRGL